MARPVPLEALSSSDDEDLGDAALDSAAGLAASGTQMRPGGGGGAGSNASDLSHDGDGAESLSEVDDSDIGSEGNSGGALDEAASLGSNESDGNSEPLSSSSEGDPRQQADAAVPRARVGADAASFPEVSSSGSEDDSAEAGGGRLSASKAALVHFRTSDGELVCHRSQQYYIPGTDM